MTIQFNSITRNADSSWTLRWTSTGTQRVVLWGSLLAETTDQTFTFGSREYVDFPPPIEVVGESEKALTELHSPTLVLQWYREELAGNYLIQQSSDGSLPWQTIATVRESGQWVYTWRSPLLEDGLTYHYRVVAMSPVANRSVPVPFHRYVITTPAPVDSALKVEYTGGNVIISAGG